MKPGLARNCLKQDIDEGNLGGFFIHLANADLTPKLVKIYLAEMLDAEADRSQSAAEKVDQSARGVEYIAGDGSAERADAENLTKLADIIRNL